MTKFVIIRVDDITKTRLKELKEWFLKYHPDVPVSVFAYATHTDEWDEEGWKLMRFLIENYGWEIGGHSRSHRFLPLLSEEELEEEIKGNIQDIESGLKLVGLNYKVLSFAYPGGGYDERVKDLLRECKIVFGLTYPDSYPYRSVDDIPSPEEYLTLGVTHTDTVVDLQIWRYWFNKSKKLYILALHTGYWSASIMRAVRNFLFDKPSVRALCREIGTRVLWKERYSPQNWEILNKHLNYMKSKNVKFITYRDLLELSKLRSFEDE